ncbi:hypothetical protein LCGC14_1872310 [marine sediment metagenome]|uniref:Uncharacterized protein n=1 Tax=marine sediment metagenome TaxID=412755 RepID=A0A0F9IIP4_9ZZZZ
MLNMKTKMPSTGAYWNVIKQLGSIPEDLHYIFLSNTVEELIQSEAKILAWKAVGCKIKSNREDLVEFHQFPVAALGWDDRYMKIRIAIKKKLKLKRRYNDQK